MKRIIIAICLILPLAILAQKRFTFYQYVIINSSAAVPIQLTNGNQYVRSVTVFGKSAFQTTNTSAINLGFGTSANGLMGITVDPGDSITIKSVNGADTFALSNIWLDVITANDGAVVYWEP
jgi:hypothetical protein